MKEKIFNRKGLIFKSLIGLMIIIILFNPQWIPFLNDEVVKDIQIALKKNFSILRGSDQSLSAALPMAFSLLSMVIGVMIATWFVKYLISKIKVKDKHSLTIVVLIDSFVRYVSVIIIGVWGLTILGVNIIGIFASLGIMGLVIGFGAQSLIQDIITGIFIILEGQYVIDDIIEIDNFRGVVKKIGVRTTTFEDASGNLKIINNSDIRNLINRSKDESLVYCAVGVSYEDDFLVIEKKIQEKVLPYIIKEGLVYGIKNIEYQGVDSLGDSSINLKFTGFVKESNYFVGYRQLNRLILIAFSENKISIPYPQLDVHSKD